LKNESDFAIKTVSWQDGKPALSEIREKVFIKEQKVPVELEWDGMDQDAIHVLAINKKGQAIGTGRLLQDGHIGRMAVLPEWRGFGAGSAILKTLIQLCLKRHQTAFLDAQVQAIPFYRKFGFVEDGPVFMDAGIPHKKMLLIQQ
jgi:predicted GNAT family N-acyltransferase